MSEVYGRIEKILKRKGYELSGLIGEGATAKVYRVKEIGSGAEYACKIGGSEAAYVCKVSCSGVEPACKTGESGAESAGKDNRWLRMESELLRSLSHPLFPKWKDYWEEEEQSYLIMEYIAGNSLEAHLKRRGRFSPRETISIALELADGLGYLHERNPRIIYRDLKPSNVILQPDGRARLLDLGAAVVPAGWLAGTPAYASPEQQLSGITGTLSGEPDNRNALFGENGGASIALQPSSDVYGLGMVMHHMLSGRNPLLSKDEIRPVRKYVSGIWLGLDDIVWSCINVHPEERIPGMRELVRELSAYYDRSKLQITGQEIKVFLRKWRRKKVIYGKNVWMSEYKL